MSKFNELHVLRQWPCVWMSRRTSCIYYRLTHSLLPFIFIHETLKRNGDLQDSESTNWWHRTLWIIFRGNELQLWVQTEGALHSLHRVHRRRWLCVQRSGSYLFRAMTIDTMATAHNNSAATCVHRLPPSVYPQSTLNSIHRSSQNLTEQIMKITH